MQPGDRFAIRGVSEPLGRESRRLGFRGDGGATQPSADRFRGRTGTADSPPTARPIATLRAVAGWQPSSTTSAIPATALPLLLIGALVVRTIWLELPTGFPDL